MISADEIGRQVVDNAPGIQEQLISAFGKEIVGSDGKLDRSATGMVAFSSSQNLQVLDRIVHPALLRQLKAEVELLRKPGPHSCIVVDAALIIRWGIQADFDVLICVTAPEDGVVERLGRKGHNTDEVKQRLDRQIPADKQVAVADYVVENDGSLEQLREKAERLYEQILGGENTV